MVCGLVEDEQVGASRLEQRQGGAGPLAGRELLRRAADHRRTQAELRQQGPYVCRRPVGHLPTERVTQGERADERPASLVHLTDDDAGAEGLGPRVERQTSEQRGDQRRLAAAVGPGDRDPVEPVQLDVERPQREGPA